MTGRLPFLDGLRAIAALWVVLGHCHLFALGWNRSGTLWGRPLDLLLYSHLGVNLFLVLSGFCLALPVVRNGNRLATSQRDYFKARAWRILPPYFATLLLLLLVNCFLPVAAWGRHPVGLTPEISWQILLTNFTLMQDFFWQFNSINGAFWSIATEWHLYFVFPAMVALLHRRGVHALLACGAIAAIVLTWLSFQKPHLSEAFPISVPQPPYFIALFAMGAASAWFAHQGRFHRRAWQLAAALAVPLVALVWKYRIVNGDNVWDFINHLHIIDPLAGGVAAALLVGLCALRRDHWLHRFLGSRALVAIGGFSYSLYLTHVPILATLNHLLENAATPQLTAFFVLAVGGSAICLLFAWAFARVFERRYLTRARSMPVDTIGRA